MKLLDPKSFDISFKKIPLKISYQLYPNSDSRAIFKKKFWEQRNCKSMWDSDSIADHTNFFQTKIEINIKDFDSLRIVVLDEIVQDRQYLRKYVAVLPKNNIDMFKLELINKIQSKYKFIYRLDFELYTSPTLYTEDMFEYEEKIFEITNDKNYYKTYDNINILNQLFSFEYRSKKEVSHFKLRSIYEESIDNSTENDEEISYNKSKPKADVLDIKNFIESPFNHYSWWNSISDNWKMIFSAYLASLNKDVKKRILLDAKLINRTKPLTKPTLEEFDSIFKMTELNCEGSDSFFIKDLAPLLRLKKLKRISISNYKIQDYSHLSQLINLTWLKLEKCQIKNIEIISELTQLEYLNLSGNFIECISNIENLKKLKKIILWDNKIRSIEGLVSSSKNNLETIYLSNNLVSDISCLIKCKNLKHLKISNNPIVDFSCIARLVKLESLDIAENNLNDISFVENLVLLRALDCKFNNINSLKPLSGLNHLEYLYVQSNLISDLNPLKHLIVLKSLTCFNNQISKLDSLENLTNLESLNIIENNISDISPISCLNKLRILSVNDNNITSIKPLELLMKKSLRLIHIRNNPINKVTLINYERDFPLVNFIY